MNESSPATVFSTIAIRPVLLVAAAVVLCVLSAGLAAKAPKVTLEEFRNYAFPEDLTVARRAGRIAWSVDDHGRRNVWVASAPAYQARQLTAYSQDDGQEISALSLSEDGAQLVYVRGGDHGSNWDGGLPANPTSAAAGEKVEIWSIPFSGGAPLHIAEGDSPCLSPDGRRIAFLKDGAVWVAPTDGATEAKRLFTTRGRPSSLAWSPDGQRLAFVAEREVHSLVGIYSDERSSIQWVAPAMARDTAPRWSPDGKRIAFVRLRAKGGAPRPALQFQPEPWSIWIADAVTGRAAMRWSSGAGLRDSYDDDFLFEWARGERIVFESYQDGWPHLYSLPAAGGDPLPLTPGEFTVEHPALSADRNNITFDANNGTERDDIDRRHVFRVSVDHPDMQALTSGSGLEWTPVPGEDGQVIFISATAQRPPVLATVPLRGGPMKSFARELVPASYPSSQLVTPRRVTFQAEDGGTVHGQLFEPVSGSGKHPAVVYIHGGPQRQMFVGFHPMAYYSNDYVLNQYLASRGFAVLSVNYRLGIGYGHDFQYPPNAGPRGGSEYRDVRAAAHYLQTVATVDPQRIGVYGGSYGGYLTAMGLAHDSGSFKAGVDIHGVHDWTADYDMSSLLPRKRYEMVPDAERALAVAWEASPVSAIATWKSPVLFIHGDDDRNVKFEQTVDLLRRLEDAGAHPESLVLPDDTHSILLYANELRMNAAIAEFLERQLGDVH